MLTTDHRANLEMVVPAQPKIYHILHVDRLESVLAESYLWSDKLVHERHLKGTTVGMEHIKRRRLSELRLSSHPDLFVGECVPFYFCPRSVMLYLIQKQNSELAYKGGQGSIIHLEADLGKTVDWADEHNRR